MHLLTETLEAINDSGHTPEQIIFIGSEATGHRCTWVEFMQLSNLEYPTEHDPGIGLDLVVVFNDGKKLWRQVNDGIEQWVYDKPFIMPKQSHAITSLSIAGSHSLLGAINKVQPAPHDLYVAARRGKLFDLPRELLSVDALLQRDAHELTPLQVHFWACDTDDPMADFCAIAKKIYSYERGLGYTVATVSRLLQDGLSMQEYDVVDVLASDKGLALDADTVAVAVSDLMGLTVDEFEGLLENCSHIDADTSAKLLRAYITNLSKYENALPVPTKTPKPVADLPAVQSKVL